MVMSNKADLRKL